MPQTAPPVSPAPPRDRVSLVVRCTLVLLLLVGVLSVFGEALLGLAGEGPGGVSPAPASSSP